jgi:integrase
MKRPNGKGSVTRHRGGWRARGPLRDDGGRESLGIYETKGEAYKAIATAEALDVDKPEGLTLAAWGERWFADRVVDGVKKERSSWRTHVQCHSIANRLVRRVTRQDVLLWLTDVAKTEATHAKTMKDGTVVRRGLGRPIARQTVKHALRILRDCLEGALDAGVIDANPIATMKMKRGATVRPDDETPHQDGVELGWSYLTQKEIDTLLGCAAIPEAHRLLWTVAIYTGLRPAELWGLRWVDVRLDEEAPSIFVRRSRRKKTKTAHAVRIVPLLRRPFEALKRWKLLSPGIGTALVYATTTKDGPGGCRAEGYDAGFKRWRKVAGVTRPGITPRSWRHTTASHLVMGTWTPRPLRLEEVRQVLGHSSITVTQRYAHLAPGGVRSLVVDRDGHADGHAMDTGKRKARNDSDSH